LIILGIILLLLGLKAMVLPLVTAIALELILGIIFIVSSVVQLLSALRLGRSNRFWFHLALGLVYFLSGLYLLLNPQAGTVTLAAIVGFLLVAVGLFEGVQAFKGHRGDKADWLLLVLSLVAIGLGLFIWVQGALAAVWMLGLIAGIGLILSGVSLLLRAFPIGGSREGGG
jgi:uncharacterized membrane protein HdeD (DUF308 family)